MVCTSPRDEHACIRHVVRFRFATELIIMLYSRADMSALQEILDQPREAMGGILVAAQHQS